MTELMDLSELNHLKKRVYNLEKIILNEGKVTYCLMCESKSLSNCSKCLETIKTNISSLKKQSS